MDVKISYFFIFGIITIATGKPPSYYAEDSQYVRNERELENILQSLADKGKFKVASNYREDVPDAYYENRASSSRYDAKPSPFYYNADSGESADEQPSIDNLQIINQFLKSNDDNPGSNNAQNLLEDLLSLDRNNRIKLLKPNDESKNVDDVVSLLVEIQKVSDEENSRDENVYGKAKDNNLRENVLYEHNLKPKVDKQIKSVITQTQNGVIQLVKDIAGNNLQDTLQSSIKSFLNLGEEELSRNDRNDRYANSYNSRDGLLCNGKTCARTNAVNNDRDTRLRCRGSYCTRTRNDDNVNKFKYDTKLSAQKIKLNDELDAIVLGVSDVERLLTKLTVPKSSRTHKPKVAKIFENVNLNKLLNSNIDRKDNVEAIVFDLTKVENGDAVARQIKQSLSGNNAESNNEYEDYGNLVENHLKRGVYDLQNQVEVNSKISPHKETKNNVYLPQWLLDDVISKAYANADTEERISRSMFPLTRQQKERNRNRKNQKVNRIYRRSLDQDVGVPFHMEVRGLGQVNP